MKRAVALSVLLAGLWTPPSYAQTSQRLLSSLSTGLGNLDCTIAGPTVERLPWDDLLRSLEQGVEAIRSRHDADDGAPPALRVVSGRPRIQPGGRLTLQRGARFIDDIWDGIGPADTAEDILRDAGRFLDAGVIDDDADESIAVLERAVLTQAFAYAVNARIRNLCDPTVGAQPNLGVRDTTAAARAVPPPATRNAQRQAPASQPGFLSGRPRLSVGLRGLLHRARAGSDFHDFANEELFVRRSPEDDPKNAAHGLLNFDAPGISFDFGFGVTSRLDVRVGVDYAASSNQSETRGFQGSDGLPIEQRTTLSQVDLRGEIAFALAPRGRAIGQYAWVPSRVVPYVGVGFSFVRYDLTQIGEFVDDLGLFQDSFTSKGWGPGVHLFGGADIRMTRHIYLNAEARYVQARAGLGEDFTGFDPLDLGALRIGAGVRFAF